MSMPKPFRFNQLSELLSTSICLIFLIVCNIFTLQLAKSRLDVVSDTTRQESPSPIRPEMHLDEHLDELPERPDMPSTAGPEASSTPYFIGLTIQSLCIAAVIIYLAMSHLCKKLLPEIYANTDKITIFILGTLLLTLTLSLLEVTTL